VERWGKEADKGIYRIDKSRIDLLSQSYTGLGLSESSCVVGHCSRIPACSFLIQTSKHHIRLPNLATRPQHVHIHTYIHTYIILMNPLTTSAHNLHKHQHNIIQDSRPSQTPAAAVAPHEPQCSWCNFLYLALDPHSEVLARRSLLHPCISGRN
jgi:hypothetical protein